MTYGYKLVGKAGRLPLDYVPSLIGIRYKQEEPSPEDVYFEQIETAGFLTGDESVDVKLSQWLAYDEVSSECKDPILEVRSGTLAFYCPASDLLGMSRDAGRVNLNEAIERLLSGRKQ